MKRAYKIYMLMTLIFAGWICFLCFASEEDADTIYLNTGGSINGIITGESASGVEAEIGAGTIVINRADIKSIRRASSETLTALRDKWAQDRAGLKAEEKGFEESRGRRLKAYEDWVGEETKRKAGEYREEGEVKIARDPDSKAILVSVILDGGVKALLELDTGASLVILSKRIGEELGIDMSSEEKNNIVELRLVGGQVARARTVILKSVAIEGIEEKDVLGAVILEDRGPSDLKDGLLGRSFLGRFNIKIDMQRMKMVLQKLK